MLASPPVWLSFAPHQEGPPQRTRIARAGLTSSRLSADSTKASVVLGTAEAYFDALLAQRLLEIAEETLAQAEVALEHARLGMQVGRSKRRGSASDRSSGGALPGGGARRGIGLVR